MKVYISLKGTEMACFGNSSGLFQVHNLVQNFCKKRHEVYVSLRCARSTKVSTRHTHTKFAPEFLILSALKLTLCEIMVFIDMNTYMLTEGWNFKTFTEKYAIV